jgi:alpha-galactosidase
MRWVHGGVALDLELREDASARLRGIGPAGRERDGATSGVPLVELDWVGDGRLGTSTGAQHRPYAASAALHYTGHEEVAHEGGVTLRVHQRDEERDVEVTSHLQAWSAGAVVRVWTEVRNAGAAPRTLGYVSSLSLGGFGPESAGRSAALRLHEARNAWATELRWQSLTPLDAGLVDLGPLDGDATTRGRHAVSAVGSWSTGDHLPMGAVERETDGTAWVWQIEHQGAWHWELGDEHRELYVLVSGPTDQEHQWRQTLSPGESFVGVPVALAVTESGLHGGLRALTDYRRAMRRPSEDTAALPVIFNDYMNCLMGDPTEARLEPLIEAAAEVGCEYFVIDAGWYADDRGWWDTVGEWEPSAARFPSGLETTLRRIRAAGMIPGLWLEPEVVGVRSPVVEQLPPDAFFTLQGNRVSENGRFHLDYRSEAVRTRMDAVVDRLVGDYGAGYLKLDYNISVPGSDANDLHPGAGLLGHNRAYLEWLDAVLDRHPGLVLENCSSGGLRMDYAMLARHSLQSTSDQRDHLLYAAIAAAAPSAVTPEQAAVWAYPQPQHSDEEAAFCLVNALLGRVHLSGRIDRMSPPQRRRVADAVDAYKGYRQALAHARPHWPLGLPGWYDEELALAMETDDESLLALWHRGAEPASIRLPLPWLDGEEWRPEPLFPGEAGLDLEWSGSRRELVVPVPAGPSARLIRLSRR